MRIETFSRLRGRDLGRELSSAVVAGLFLMPAFALAGSTDAQKCEADKLKRAGKYAFCRMKAESKAVKKGEAPDYSKCDAKLGEKFTKAELKWGAECITLGDAGAVQSQVSGDTDDLAFVLAGGILPLCGDGTIDAGEQCDGVELGGATCDALVANTGGTLGCTADCQYDVSGCASAPAAMYCGDGVADLGESCDGSDLRGETCATLGYTESEGLACDSQCRLDHSGCATDSAPSRFRDNGDGTATDLVSGLQWELKTECAANWTLDGTYSGVIQSGTFTGEVSQDGATIQIEGVDWYSGAFSCTATVVDSSFSGTCLNQAVAGSIDCVNQGFSFSFLNGYAVGGGSAVPPIHDVDNRYSLCEGDGNDCDGEGTAETMFLDVLNDVAGGGTNCFAGHCDWRLPTVLELRGLLLEPYFVPNPGGPCSASPCVAEGLPGATASYAHWSSTSHDIFDSAWSVLFDVGGVSLRSKNGGLVVRAVRGAS